MGLILSIETSTDICSVALSQDGKLVAERTITQGQSHASSLTVIIGELFQGEGMPEIKMLEAVAVSSYGFLHRAAHWSEHRQRHLLWIKHPIDIHRIASSIGSRGTQPRQPTHPHRTHD